MTTRPCQTVAILALAGLAGCGGSEEEDSYKLVRVAGTIAQDGKPMAGGTVWFLPVMGNQHPTPGSAQIGPDGEYLLMFKGRTGVSPGKYKVIVEPAGGDLPAGPDDPPTFGMAPMARHERKRGVARPKAEPARGEFDAEVEDGASQELNFDVKVSSSTRATAKE